MSPSPLRDKVYQLLNQIPPGRVTTYREIAQALDCKAYRAIGRILNRNPNAPRVPCHRVVMSDGTLGGYAFGTDRKNALLRQEGVSVVNNRIEDFSSKLFRFSQQE
jgi:methylated-DNA-[protein]-cysteine S-methyltransferase